MFLHSSSLNVELQSGSCRCRSGLLLRRPSPDPRVFTRSELKLVGAVLGQSAVSPPPAVLRRRCLSAGVLCLLCPLSPLSSVSSVLCLLSACGTVRGFVRVRCLRVCGNVARGGEHEHVGHAHSGRSPESGLHPDHPGPAAERTAGGAPGHVPVHTPGARLAQLVCVPVFRSGGAVVFRGAARLLLHPHLQPEHQDAVHQLPPDGVLPLLCGRCPRAHRLHRRCRESLRSLCTGHCHGVWVPHLVPDGRFSVDHLQCVLWCPSDRCGRLNL